MKPAAALSTIIKPDKDASEIGDLYRKARISLIDSVRYAHACGERLIAKKEQLKRDVGYGNWLPWLRDNADAIGFDTPRTAQMLMKLAANAKLASHLDEAEAVAVSRELWGHTNDDGTTIDLNIDDLLRDADGRLTPKARAFIREVKAEKTESKKAIRSAREAALAGKQLALPQKKYGVILADPEWHFQVGSDAWMSTTHASNHYATSPTEEIAARPVEDIAADDCVLFLWATSPMLPQGLEVMKAWGFEYKSSATWVKDKAGTGYWFRNQHELLLVGTRGDVPCPAPGTQWSSVIEAPRGRHSAWSSVIEAPRGRHSEKPERAYELIEHYFPTLPKIELNARGPAREGWDVWGYEAIAGAEAAE